MSHLWFFNGMNDAVRQIVHQMETLKRLLLNRQPRVQHAPELVDAAGITRQHNRAAA